MNVAEVCYIDYIQADDTDGYLSPEEFAEEMRKIVDMLGEEQCGRSKSLAEKITDN